MPCKAHKHWLHAFSNNFGIYFCDFCVTFATSAFAPVFLPPPYCRIQALLVGVYRAAALLCRQMAAAAATLRDSSPPGWVMRSSRCAISTSAGCTPWPSCPNTQAQGWGSWARWSMCWPCRWVTSRVFGELLGNSRRTTPVRLDAHQLCIN